MRCLKMFALLAGVLVICFSCGKEGYDFGGGSVRFNLNTDYSTSMVGTKADNALNLDTDDFTLEVFNSSGVKFKKWRYGDIKGDTVRMNDGSFTAKAYYGDSTATGFDAIYFAGKTNFTVAGQNSTPVSLVCRMANVKVAVAWGPNISADYADYSVRIYRSGKDGSLVFSKTETRSGYIPHGSIKMDITLKDKNGAERVYTPKAVACEANDFITFTIDTKAAAKEEVTVSFQIKKETDDKSETIVIPAVLVAKDAPSFTTAGFDNNSVSFVEGSGVTGDLYVGITAPAFLKSCVLVSQSDFLPSNWPNEIDLMGNNEGGLSTIKAYGITWNLSANSRYGLVNFEELTKKLRSDGENTSRFSLKVTDAKGKDSTINLSFNITGATIAINSIPEYDMWATKAYINVTTNATDAAKFAFEAMNGSAVLQTFTPQLVSRSGNVSRFMVTGLTPETNYSFRVNYCNGLKYTEQVAGTTEAAQPLNNGTLEEWSATEIYGGNGTFSTAINCDFASGWCTRNEVTTYGAKDATMGFVGIAGNYGLYYRWYSGTISTTDAKSGKAAEISTLAFWQEKSGTLSVSNRSDIYGYVKDSGKAYSGYLFLGTIDKENDTCTLGIEHGSRPESVSFWYKYAPCSGGDNCSAYAVVYDVNKNEIARTDTFKSSGMSLYTQQIMKFNYTNTTVKAKYITVFFKSGDVLDITKMQQVEGSYTITPYPKDRIVGSVLTVDDVVLNY